MHCTVQLVGIPDQNRSGVGHVSCLVQFYGRVKLKCNSLSSIVQPFILINTKQEMVSYGINRLLSQITTSSYLYRGHFRGHLLKKKGESYKSVTKTILWLGDFLSITKRNECSFLTFTWKVIWKV